MSLIIARAIKSIDPDSRFSIKSGIVDWETDPIDQSLVDAEVARLQAEQVANAYQRERADAYKSLAEQLDLLYWDYKNGTEEWMAHIDAVKAAHPKPE